MPKKYWLIKSEGTCYSIDDLRRDKKTAWTGIRNYQARNFMAKDMSLGDLLLFYHSNADPSAVVGIAKVVSASHLDLTALDPKDEHYDPKSTKEKPIWECIDVAFISKFKRPVSLHEIKFNPKLEGIPLAERGSRLSIMPISEKHFEEICRMGE